MEAFITDLGRFEDNIVLIRETGIPEVIDKDLLQAIGINNPNSVFFVKLFRTLGLINNEGIPSEDYPRFVRSDTSSRIVMAEKVKQTYKDVFKTNPNAHRLSREQIRDLFKDLLNGNKSETFARMIADTFKTLVDFASWDATEAQPEKRLTPEPKSNSHVEFILELMNDSAEHTYCKDTQPVVNDLKYSDDSETDTSVKTAGNAVNGTTFQEDQVSEPSATKEKVINEPITSTKEEIYLSKALERKASLLEKLERYEEAVSTFDQILDRCKTTNRFGNALTLSEIFIRKAETLEKLEDYERALGTYEHFIQWASSQSNSVQVQNMN